MAAALLLYTRFKASLVIIPATWVYATLDHSIYTYQINNGVAAIGYLTLGGYTIAIILALAVPIALVFDYLRRRHITLRMPAIGVRAVLDAWRLGPTFIARVLRVIAVGRYHRGRNGAINAVWRDRLEHPDLRSLSKWAVIAFIAAEEPLTDQEAHPAYTQPPVPPPPSHDGPQAAPAEDGYGYIAPPHGTDTHG